MLKYVNNDNFEKEVLKSNKPILVDFFATWCGPCQMLNPVLEKISNSRADFEIAKINVDESGELANRYGIKSVPTMIIFKNGIPVETIQGYNEEEVIVDKMSRYMD